MCRTPTSDTFTQSVNTVDSLFAAFPAFLHFNPELAGYLLAPLLKYQDSEAYNLPYAARNIGMLFAILPISIVHVINHDIHVRIQISERNCRWPWVRPQLRRWRYARLLFDYMVFWNDVICLETSNMLIMTLAYTQISGNKTFIDNHYGLLRNWANYLVNNSLTPANQYAVNYL